MTRTRSLRSRSLRRGRLDPLREIELHYVTGGPARGWLHTHGLAAHGKPELEVRNVPQFLRAAASGLLNDLADYLLNDAVAPLVAGESLGWGSASILAVEAKPDPAAGYDPEHYADVRLTLVDPPERACDCDECARELAARPRVTH